MIQTLNTYEEFQEVVQAQAAVLVYFSHEACNVCKVLKPKVVELIENEFPRIQVFYVDTVNSPMIAGQERIFAVPTLIVYFDGREYFRKSRNIGLDELRKDIERPYGMLFEE